MLPPSPSRLCSNPSSSMKTAPHPPCRPLSAPLPWEPCKPAWLTLPAPRSFPVTAAAPPWTPWTRVLGQWQQGAASSECWLGRTRPAAAPRPRRRRSLQLQELLPCWCCVLLGACYAHPVVTSTHWFVQRRQGAGCVQAPSSLHIWRRHHEQSLAPPVSHNLCCQPGSWAQQAGQRFLGLVGPCRM